MTAYNIVGASSLVGGQPEDVSQVLANFQAIQAVINGSLDNSNIAGGAGILLSKLGQSGAVNNQVPVWNGTTWVPSSVPAAAYNSYVPSWLSTGTAPAFNNASVVARYAQSNKLVHAYGTIYFGSTTVFGSGAYFFGLPVAGNETTLADATQVYGSAAGFQFSSGNFAPLTPVFQNTSLMIFDYPSTWLGPRANVGAAGPWAWAVNDYITWNVIYESV